MKPTLYCFKLDESTGILTMYEIEDYATRRCGPRTFYAYTLNIDGKKRRYDFRDENIDKFTNLKLYTFNPSYNRAVEIIEQALITKCNLYKIQLERYQNLFARFLVERSRKDLKERGLI